MASALLKFWSWATSTHTLGIASSPVKLSKAEEKEAMAKAMKLLGLIKNHKFDEAFQDETETIKLHWSPSALETLFEDLQVVKGSLISFKPVGVERYGGEKVAKVLVKFEKEDLMAVITIDTAGLIAMFRLAVMKEVESKLKKPSYAKLDRFIEEHKHITLVAGEIAVEAILSVPREKPIAGVVVLGGSGPTESDSTINPNEPLKDLAWGLASNGIIVCRRNNLSAESSSNGSDEGITLKKEHLPYATAAIKALRYKLNTIDGHTNIPIFLLGHSLGGMVAPMVANADPSIWGLLLLNAAGGKLYHSALRQAQYLASQDTKVPGIPQSYIDLLTKQVATIDNPDFDESIPAEDLPFGAPASYWLSVKKYDQVAAAAKLEVPILILQSGRGYQVTVDDDFCLWKEALNSRENVTMKVYEGLNHQFIFGEKASDAEDIKIKGHVDEGAVMDISAWIKELCSKLS